MTHLEQFRPKLMEVFQQGCEDITALLHGLPSLDITVSDITPVMSLRVEQDMVSLEPPEYSAYIQWRISGMQHINEDHFHLSWEVSTSFSDLETPQLDSAYLSKLYEDILQVVSETYLQPHHTKSISDVQQSMGALVCTLTYLHGHHHGTQSTRIGKILAQNPYSSFVRQCFMMYRKIKSDSLASEYLPLYMALLGHLRPIIVKGMSHSLFLHLRADTLGFFLHMLPKLDIANLQAFLTRHQSLLDFLSLHLYQDTQGVAILNLTNRGSGACFKFQQSSIVQTNLSSSVFKRAQLQLTLLEK